MAYVEADGNYVHVTCLFDKKFHLNYSISEFLSILTSHVSGNTSFLRIDRSLVVNANFITRIIPYKRTLLLSDGQTWTCRLELPQKTLKRLCDQLNQKFASNNKKDALEDKHTLSND